MENAEQMIWKIWEKRKLNSDKIWKVWKENQLNSEMIWKIWKKGKSNSDEIWKILKKIIYFFYKTMSTACNLFKFTLCSTVRGNNSVSEG